MARIRTIKPEFWDSPSTAQADLAVRLTFIAMWNWADDSGHGTANLKELEAFCFPNDDVADLPRRSSGSSAGSRGNSAPVWRNFAEVCGEVAEAYGVTFYRVKGRPFYRIDNFKKHQSKDYRPTSKYPPVEEGEIYDVTSGNIITHESDAGHSAASAGHSATSGGNSAAPAGNSGIGTGEQGNRGTGDKDHDQTDGLNEREQKPPPSRFDEFWDTYPRKVGKKKARSKYDAAVKRTGNEQTVIDGAHRMAEDPNLPEQRFIPHPTTWLERDGWHDDPLPPRATSTTPNTHQPRRFGTHPDDWNAPAEHQTDRVDYTAGATAVIDHETPF